MEGSRRVGRASDGDEKEGAWRGASFHANQRVQPGIDIHELGRMEGGRRAGYTSDRDEKEGAWRGTSRHAGQHEQPSVNVQESRPMEGGRRAGRANEARLCAHSDGIEGDWE